MQPVRCGDQHCDARFTLAWMLFDLVFHRGDRALAHLVRASRVRCTISASRAIQSRYRRLVAVAPVPVLADADVLEVATALDVEERRPPISIRFSGRRRERDRRFRRLRCRRLGVGAEWSNRVRQRLRDLTRLARRVDRVAVVLADEHHRQRKAEPRSRSPRTRRRPSRRRRRMQPPLRPVPSGLAKAAPTATGIWVATTPLDRMCP